jgi:hypothetical protein
MLKIINGNRNTKWTNTRTQTAKEKLSRSMGPTQDNQGNQSMTTSNKELQMKSSNQGLTSTQSTPVQRIQPVPP